MKKQKNIYKHLLLSSLLLSNATELPLAGESLLVRAEMTEEKTKQDLKLTFSGKESHTFNGKGLYAIDFQDIQVDTIKFDENIVKKIEEDIVYTLYLPVGVEPASQTNQQLHYNKESRLLTLEKPKTSQELLAIFLQFDLQEDTQLQVTKTSGGYTTTSNQLALKIEKQSKEKISDVLPFGEEKTQESPKLSLFSETTLLEKPTTRASSRPVPVNGVIEVENWMDFIDAINNFQTTQIVLKDNVVFPKVTGSETNTKERTLKGRYELDRGNAGLKDEANGYAENLDWYSGINTWTANQGTAAYLRIRRNNAAHPGRDQVVINGQGKYAIDFGMIAFTFTDGQAHDITLQNLTTYSGNYYGHIRSDELPDTIERQSKLTYENVIAHGSQMISSPLAPVELKGYVSHIMDDDGRYRSPFRPNDPVSYNHRGNARNEANIHTTNLTIAENAQIYLYNSSGGNIEIKGEMIIGKQAIVSLNSSFEFQRSQGNGSPTGGGDEGGANLRVRGAGLTLEEQARLFISKKEYTPTGSELWENKSGYLWFPANNSTLNIKKGASLEIYAPNHKGVDKVPDDIKGPIFYMSGTSAINVQEYGNFSIFAPGKGNGLTTTAPVYLNNGGSKMSLSVENNATFEVVSDTITNLVYLSGTNKNNADLRFNQARRVNLQRYNAQSTTRDTLRALIGSAGEVSLSIKKQHIAQWDDNNQQITPSSVKITKLQSIHYPDMHEEVLPSGQQFITNATWDKMGLDNTYTHQWTSVNEVSLNYKGETANATSSDLVPTYQKDKEDIEKKLGRSGSVQTQTGASTGGNKPNQLLLKKIDDLEIQIFSSLTDDENKKTQTYSGSVTNGYQRETEGTPIFDAKGDYILEQQVENAENKTFSFDPRNEIVGRVGSYQRHYSFDEAQRKMVITNVFLPTTDAAVKVAANGSIQPVTQDWDPSKWHSEEKPFATEKIDATEFTTDILSTSQEFKDATYSVSSTKENGQLTTSTGSKIDGAGYFIYKMPNNINLKAEDLVKVATFKEGGEFVYGKEGQTKTLLVKDETKPTAIAKKGLKINYTQSSQLPEPSSFLESTDDTNPYKGVNDFYSYTYDYSASSNDKEVKVIKSEQELLDVLTDIKTDPKQKFLLGIVIKDAAGNQTKINVVFFRTIDFKVKSSVKDIYIKETDLEYTSFSKDEQQLKNLLVQNGIEKINYQLIDGITGKDILSKDYLPSKSFDSKSHLFRIDSLNGFFTEKEVGKMYTIDATILANKANPTKDPSLGITEDFSFQFYVMLTSDMQAIVSTEDVHFGEKEVTGAETTTGKLDMSQETSIRIIDTTGMYDTSKANTTTVSVENGSGEVDKIDLGTLEDIKDVTTIDNANVQHTWKISAEMTQPFTNENNVELVAGIHFLQGNISENVHTETFAIDRSIFYNQGAIEIANGKIGNNFLFQKGNHLIQFGKEDVQLNILEDLKDTGNYTAKLTYTLESTPND